MSIKTIKMNSTHVYKDKNYQIEFFKENLICLRDTSKTKLLRNVRNK
jgi:hypothetical protein